MDKDKDDIIEEEDYDLSIEQMDILREILSNDIGLFNRIFERSIDLDLFNKIVRRSIDIDLFNKIVNGSIPSWGGYTD